MYIACFLQLGTNKGNKFKNLESAINCIELDVGKIIIKSSVYETEPWGYHDNETYFNQVIKVETLLNPAELLKTCLNIENSLGRLRTKSEYESRTMDIDILFYGNQIINTENLIIPHPKLHERNFVLTPMVELESELIHPVFNKSMKDLDEVCTDSGWIKRIKNPSSE